MEKNGKHNNKGSTIKQNSNRKNGNREKRDFEKKRQWRRINNKTRRVMSTKRKTEKKRE